MHSVWVHGTSARPEWVGDNLWKVKGDDWSGGHEEIGWSDINGLPRGWGTTFRGKRAFTGGLGGSTVGPFDPTAPFQYSQKGYWFHFPIPTPVITPNGRAALRTVFLLYEERTGAEVWAVHVFHGLDRIAAFGVDRHRMPPQQPTGRRGFDDLIEGVSRFDLPSPHTMLFSVGISVAVAFTQDADITFISAGADFEP